MLRNSTLRYGALVLAGVVLLFVVLPAACSGLGSGGDDDDDDAGRSASLTGAAQPTATTGGAAAMPTYAAEGQDSSSAVTPGTSGGASAAPADWDRMVIRNASISLIVSDVEGAVAWVRSIAIGKGGFVFASNSYMQDERQLASLTIQVPVERFDEALSELRAGQLVEEVEREESSAQDVTAEYVDNESRLSALRTTYDRLLALLGTAESVDDILRLEYELQNVRSEIETIQGRQNYLENVTAFSTIAVSLVPPGTPAPRTGDTFSLRQTVADAWDRARGTVEGMLTAAITITIFLLVFAPLIAVVYVVFRVGRGLMRRFAGGAP
jgi:hypothetical protein